MWAAGIVAPTLWIGAFDFLLVLLVFLGKKGSRILTARLQALHAGLEEQVTGVRGEVELEALGPGLQLGVSSDLSDPRISNT